MQADSRVSNEVEDSRVSNEVEDSPSYEWDRR